MRRWVSASLLLAAGCGSSGATTRGPVTGATGQTPTTDAPLVTEWGAAEKANLEARLRETGVVVQFTGRDLRLVPGCRVTGRYAWRRTTTSTDVREMRTVEDLAAKLPLGGLSLQGELQRSGQLAVQTTVAGQYQLDGLTAADVPETPECASATHVVGAVSMGAFQLRTGGSLRTGGGATVGGLGAEGSSRSEESVVRSSGDPRRCSQATDAAPDPECASPVQVFLVPLPRFEKQRGSSGAVQATFLGEDSRQPWEVRSGDAVVCTTPCTHWVDPARPLSMRARIVQAPQVVQTVEVPDLRAAGPEPRISARLTSNGRLVGGISAAGIGGLALFVGGFLALARCDGEHPGTCVGSLVTMGVSLPLGALGAYLIVGSGARAEVVGSAPPRTIRLGGTF